MCYRQVLLSSLEIRLSYISSWNWLKIILLVAHFLFFTQIHGKTNRFLASFFSFWCVCRCTEASFCLTRGGSTYFTLVVVWLYSSYKIICSATWIKNSWKLLPYWTWYVSLYAGAHGAIILASHSLLYTYFRFHLQINNKHIATRNRFAIIWP